MLDGATRFGSNGGKAGSFTLTTTSGNYGWYAALRSATTGGVTFTSASAPGFPGGWEGAQPAPVLFTDAGGAVWELFRQDYPNANPTAETWTTS